MSVADGIKQKNGLPQGSVLSPILFNMYTNDQPIHDGTRNFIYADDLCVTVQYSSFTEVETTIGYALEELTQYYSSNSLRANPDKTQVTAFHLRNKEATTGEYHDDLIRMALTLEQHGRRAAEWRAILLDKELKESLKLMVGRSGGKMIINSGKWPCGVCGK